MEEWRSIDGFPGYMVSSYGNVRSRKNYQGGFAENYHTLKPRRNPNGYLVVVLHDGQHVPHQISVHRLVASTFMPTSDNSLVVDHLDGNKTNNTLDNLEWVSPKENSVRAYNAGLYEPIFEITRRPVLVTDIYTGEEMYFDGVNDAARTLGLSSSLISRVANGLSNRVGHYIVEFAGREERLLYTKHY